MLIALNVARTKESLSLGFTDVGLNVIPDETRRPILKAQVQRRVDCTNR